MGNPLVAKPRIYPAVHPSRDMAEEDVLERGTCWRQVAGGSPTRLGSGTPAPSSQGGTCLVMCTWVAPLGKIPSRDGA
eukprot:scaffold7_cov414-Pavlova_lutheri.AAC.18